MHEFLDYFHTLQSEPPADLPIEAIQKKAGQSEAVAIGFAQLWQGVHMRRMINNKFTVTERRTLEADIREQMSMFDLEQPDQNKTWHELHHIHHWSVTADQAEMIAAVF